jgi:heat-inducible transcriptional repressor
MNYRSKNTIELELSSREQAILRSVVNLYIANAAPVGSRKLSKFLEKNLSLSPATIRNVMVDLEERDLITHPHTSAGRIPTDKGYRFYVDYLMQLESLSKGEHLAISNLVKENKTSETALKETSKILGILSKYLALVRLPTTKSAKVKKIELIKLSSTHILVVLALESNLVNTVTLEARFSIADALNERISGLELSELQNSFPEIVSDMDVAEKPLIRLFVDSVDSIFRIKSQQGELFTSGTQNLLDLPEFEDMGKVKSIIELVENEDIIVHLLDNMPIND